MSTLTLIFYSISSALLVPAELGLLLALALALRALGVSARDALRRRKARPLRADVDRLLRDRNLPGLDPLLAAPERKPCFDPALDALREFVANAADPALLEKSRDEYEARARVPAEKSERLAKLGPALGLICTLIPLGPALIGLAQGDLESLASNLVVAFSTTVVGLVVAILASWNASLRRKWARADFAFLNFALDRLDEAQETRE